MIVGWVTKGSFFIEKGRIRQCIIQKHKLLQRSKLFGCQIISCVGDFILYHLKSTEFGHSLDEPVIRIDVFRRQFNSPGRIMLNTSVVTCIHESTGHVSDKITLEQLSAIFHVSGTSIKNSFRAVYGVSVYSHIRTQKMQMAAQFLLQSDDTVLEIAGQFGYENASKFSSAFKDVMGMTPNEYRLNAKKKS